MYICLTTIASTEYYAKGDNSMAAIECYKERSIKEFCLNSIT